MLFILWLWSEWFGELERNKSLSHFNLPSCWFLDDKLKLFIHILFILLKIYTRPSKLVKMQAITLTFILKNKRTCKKFLLSRIVRKNVLSDCHELFFQFLLYILFWYYIALFLSFLNISGYKCDFKYACVHY